MLQIAMGGESGRAGVQSVWEDHQYNVKNQNTQKPRII